MEIHLKERLRRLWPGERRKDRAEAALQRGDLEVSLADLSELQERRPQAMDDFLYLARQQMLRPGQPALPPPGLEELLKADPQLDRQEQAAARELYAGLSFETREQAGDCVLAVLREQPRPGAGFFRALGGQAAAGFSPADAAARLELACLKQRLAIYTADDPATAPSPVELPAAALQRLKELPEVQLADRAVEVSRLRRAHYDGLNPDDFGTLYEEFRPLSDAGASFEGVDRLVSGTRDRLNEARRYWQEQHEHRRAERNQVEARALARHWPDLTRDEPSESGGLLEGDGFIAVGGVRLPRRETSA